MEINGTEGQDRESYTDNQDRENYQEDPKEMAPCLICGEPKPNNVACGCVCYHEANETTLPDGKIRCEDCKTILDPKKDFAAE